MGKEHLTYFKVENFKRFDSLELTDIGQFNLIVGDNNVGKTSVLEALLISKDANETVTNLNSSHAWRGMEFKINTKKEDKDLLDANLFKLFFRNKDKPITAELHIDENGENKKTDIELSVVDNKIKIVINGTNSVNIEPYPTPDSDYFPFISYSLSFDDDLLRYFSSMVDKGRESFNNFILLISSFVLGLEDMRINKIANKDVIILGWKDKNDWMPLQMFGDGVKRLFRIALETMQTKGRRLMIDEIDTGIHYTRMKGFLKNIIQLAIKNDVQLFVTTHSLECQQAFAEVFEDPDMVGHQSKVRQFSLIEKPDGQVVANPHNFEQLQYALEIGFETRGGRPG